MAGRWQRDGTWMDAPAAYQKGPEIPKFHATLDDWRRVAAHVHCDTMTCAGWGSAVTRSGRTLGAGAGIEAGIGAGGGGAEGVRTWGDRWGWDRG